MPRFALALAFCAIGCGSEDPLPSTRPADTGYVVTEVSVTDTGTAVVDSSEGGVDDTGSMMVMDSSRDTESGD